MNWRKTVIQIQKKKVEKIKMLIMMNLKKNLAKSYLLTSSKLMQLHVYIFNFMQDTFINLL